MNKNGERWSYGNISGGLPHAPGPVIIRDSDGVTIAHVFRDRADYQAIVDLIAAAPETAAERDRLKAACGVLQDALLEAEIAQW